MIRRLSLRARLLLGVIAIAAVGLVAADIATYTELRSFLLDRVDSTLNSTHPGVAGALLHRQGPHPGGAPGRGPGPGGNLQALFNSIPGDCIELRRTNQRIVSQGCIPEFGETGAAPGPDLPVTITMPAHPNTPEGDKVKFFTADAKSGGGRYRVRTSIEANAPNYIIVISTPLGGVDSTLHRLLLVELLVTAIVLLTMTALGLWVVRVALRPLDQMGKTADAIAAGDLSRRVEPTDDRTEVGRLGLALNSMLSNIEEAVTDRDNSLQALEASESKLRRFVADASHELRTPLAAVRAYAELFTRGAASRPDDLERSMKGISRESERMSVLVEDLLLLAHLDEGRPLTLEPVALEDVVAESLETARTLEPRRPVEASLAAATVPGDRDRLRQVVDNLLANVRSHTPPEAPLHVTLARDETDAVLTIADSGPGMTPEQLASVFERFYRADPSRARSSGGAGLGLAIVSAVVEAHHGKVEVEST
ncbi:MAG TPA: HAMP domain-containing sensor histidine kinase, partial [Gaiellaceae bacterium]|nr:HAMP domain-containing sensor histidine kinase [Gaiellaceae bacterium]